MACRRCTGLQYCDNLHRRDGEAWIAAANRAFVESYEQHWGSDDYQPLTSSCVIPYFREVYQLLLRGGHATEKQSCCACLVGVCLSASTSVINVTHKAIGLDLHDNKIWSWRGEKGKWIAM
jgi:hypothetical protein